MVYDGTKDKFTSRTRNGAELEYTKDEFVAAMLDEAESDLDEPPYNKR